MCTTTGNTAINDAKFITRPNDRYAICDNATTELQCTTTFLSMYFNKFPETLLIDGVI